MKKVTTHFEQIDVETVKKIAEAEFPADKALPKIPIKKTGRRPVCR